MFKRRSMVFILVICFSPVTFAGYGANAIAYGAEGLGMGSADVARSHTALGSNVNPAGMSAIKNHNFALYTEFFSFFGWEHKDSLGNNKSVDPGIASVYGGGYAYRPTNYENLVFGVAMVAQGGVGFTYPELLTESGGKDELSALFGIYRVAPAVAWQASERLSLGVSIGLNYSQADQKAFPETSIAPSDVSSGFAGLDLEGLSGLSVSYRLGMQYKFSEELILGMAYAGPATLKLEGGSAVINFEGYGLGKVKYKKAKLRGLELASEFNVGLEWQLNSSWELAAEVNYLQWSRSMKSTRLTLSNPDSAAASPVIQVDTPLNFRDQVVFAVGSSYEWREGTHLLGGFTYGRNPVPKDTINPVFSLISEYHYTIGVAQKINAQWRALVSGYYTPPNKVRYTNDGSYPLGEYSQERGEGADITFTIERNW